MKANDYALIPVKGAWLGKSRLSDSLGLDDRHEFNLLQLKDTLVAVLDVFGSTRCVVVSGCPEVRAVVESAGVLCLQEPSPGLNQALAHGRNILRMMGARMLTVLPVDLPHISPATLDDVLGRYDSSESFIVPDKDLLGTNAFHFPAALAFEFQYGDGSFLDHLHALVGRGVIPHVHDETPLCEDLDWTAQLLRVPRYRQMFRSISG